MRKKRAARIGVPTKILVFSITYSWHRACENDCVPPLTSLPHQRIAAMSKRSSTWISDWNPEDETFWKTKGKTIARRTLIWSIVAEHLGFSICLLWSIVETKLPKAGFHYT